MPKKDNQRSKAKKRARQEELQREKERQVRVKAANFNDDGSVRNTLSDFVSFQKFARNGHDLTVSFDAGSTVEEPVSSEMFCILKENMEQLYTQSGWGWKESEKRGEHKDDMARFLIARNKDGNILGFTHFRFLLENSLEVLYIYELQVSKMGRRAGLGRHMMVLCELMARKQGMQKVMLTVFKDNLPAMNFYLTKMKYGIDETSPSMSQDEEDQSATYEILSKRIAPPKVPVINAATRAMSPNAVSEEVIASLTDGKLKPLTAVTSALKSSP